MENSQFYFINKSINLDLDIEDNKIHNFYLLIINNQNIDIEVKCDLKINAIVNISAINFNTQNYIANINYSTNSFNNNTKVNIDHVCFGLDNSKSKISINCQVNKNIKNNFVNQSIKGYILSSKAHIIGEPILKIYTEEINAKHSLNIGSLNKDELFYLQTKGIDISTAKKMIIWAMVENILNYSETSKKQEYTDMVLKILKQN